MTDEQRKTFEAASRPLIEWMAQNIHPHAKALVDSTSAELVEGVNVFNTKEYLRG